MVLDFPDPKPEDISNVLFIHGDESKERVEKIIAFIKIQLRELPHDQNPLFRSKEALGLVYDHRLKGEREITIADVATLQDHRIEEAGKLYRRAIIDFIGDVKRFESTISSIRDSEKMRESEVYFIYGFKPIDYLTLIQQMYFPKNFGKVGNAFGGRIFPS